MNERIILNVNRQVYGMTNEDFEYSLRHNEGARRGSDLAHDELARHKAGEDSEARSYETMTQHPDSRVLEISLRLAFRSQRPERAVLRGSVSQTATMG